MQTHSPKRASSRAARSSRRTIWLAAFVFALVCIVLALRYALPPVDAASQTSEPAAIDDPAQQAVWDYLLNHMGSRAMPTPAVLHDPAQQGVMSYVNAHEAARSDRSISGLWDQATQAVLDYLRIHSR